MNFLAAPFLLMQPGCDRSSAASPPDSDKQGTQTAMPCHHFGQHRYAVGMFS